VKTRPIRRRHAICVRQPNLRDAYGWDERLCRISYQNKTMTSSEILNGSESPCFHYICLAHRFRVLALPFIVPKFRNAWILG
jgi:hypothetical protein